MTVIELKQPPVRLNMLQVAVIPAEKQPLCCEWADSNGTDCELTAAVYIKCDDHGLMAPLPVCAGHAHMVFSGWMVGL